VVSKTQCLGLFDDEPLVPFFPTTTNLTSGNWVTVTDGVPFTGLKMTNAPGTAFFQLH
jgi:hypothetical protein